MALTTGARLGPYEVLAPLGQGGMGEVYRARDARLGRDVAIKILPQVFTADPERIARFEREARVLASLNHPHIAAIYGVEHAEGIRALVLELVEGETLADRLRAAPIPVVDALVVAAQIADALEAAHEKGIVHRDLKPANISITRNGSVKVLDFGLAKAGATEMAADLTQSPTITIDGTHQGMILGTAAYMSPEQARGQTVDKRTDVWAFGCVLYEMLTGLVAFRGETVSDTIVAVLEREPDWQALPRGTPPGITRLLQRCLQKDPTRRLRDIGDARVEINDAIATPSAAAVTVPVGARLLRARWAVALTAGLLVLVGSLYMFVRNARRDEGGGAPAIRAMFAQLTAQPGVEWFPSLSPDGKWIVYAGEGAGNRDIYLQSVTGQTPINLTKDSLEDDDQPAFSPDGERIAFRSNRDGGGIFVMGRTGEAVRRVTRMGFRPAWSPDGKHLAFNTENVDVNPQNGRGPSELWTVDIDSEELHKLQAGDGLQASWSPHGIRIAYMQRAYNLQQQDIWTIAVAGGDAGPVITDASTDWNPVWSPDGNYLYYTSDRSGSTNLWRVRIDERSGKRLGDPQALTTPASFAVHPSVSADGKRIAYSSVLITTNVQKLVIDPANGSVAGDPVWLTSGSRPWANPDPSSDGQKVVFYSRFQPEGDLYVVHADGTGLRQVTGDAATDRVPRWSPDGNWIAFFSNRSGQIELWKIRDDGSDLQQLTEGGGTYPAWSPDGSRIATTRLSGPAQARRLGNAYIFDPNRPWKDQTPQFLSPLEPSSDHFVVNAWSPDGEHLAGQIGLDGTGIATYSLRTGRYDRLTKFGEWPVWLPDSRHLIFASGGKDFLVIDRQSKQVRKVFSSNRDVLGPPQLTRDGRTAYFSRRVTEADIWLVTLQ